VSVVRDRLPGRGPLEGLAAGLRAMPPDVEAVYATSCDVPLLVPDFVRRMFALVGDHLAAVPQSGGFRHPLAAVYRTCLLPTIDELLTAGELRPTFLLESIDTRVVSEAEFRDVDPRRGTLQNLNRPEDYFAALAAAGFEAPPHIAAKLRAMG
jgi:molybdopterin-guanine dinucleotide biosynthesis protein A